MFSFYSFPSVLVPALSYCWSSAPTNYFILKGAISTLHHSSLQALICHLPSPCQNNSVCKRTEHGVFVFLEGLGINADEEINKNK